MAPTVGFHGYQDSFARGFAAVSYGTESLVEEEGPLLPISMPLKFSQEELIRLPRGRQTALAGIQPPLLVMPVVVEKLLRRSNFWIRLLCETTTIPTQPPPPPVMRILTMGANVFAALNRIGTDPYTFVCLRLAIH